MQHEESYKCTSVEECGGESYWKWNIKRVLEGSGSKASGLSQADPLSAERETLSQNLLNLLICTVSIPLIMILEVHTTHAHICG